jgi:hypothetical protein
MRNISITLLVGSVISLTAAAAAGMSFLGSLSHPRFVGSTVPPSPNGDVNPYGVAIVPVSQGTLVKGNVLVSNFNNSANLQGTGTTIVQLSPSGGFSVFAQISADSLTPPCPGGVGLTTALVALSSGFVIVGSLPTTDGTAATAGDGCLIVLNAGGQPVETFSGNGIKGPWDMTAVDMGTVAVLFVTNVLNGTVAAGGSVVNQGSVLRIMLSIPMGGMPALGPITTIASTFGERTDPAALVIGPTGVALSGNTLYVADTLNNRIASISDALRRSADAHAGMTVAQGGPIKQPLGLAVAPNGDILTVNAADGKIVETTPAGVNIDARTIDLSHTSHAGGGTLFGLAIAPNLAGVYYVDDGNNTLNILP